MYINRKISRGDVRYIEPYTNIVAPIGSEQKPGRPAIIVSNNTNNDHSNTVEVVYLTTQVKPNLPTHVAIHSTGRDSTALCEQIHTVDNSRIGDFVSACNAREMKDVDNALLISLGMDYNNIPVTEMTDTPSVDNTSELNEELNGCKAALAEETEKAKNYEKQLTAANAKLEMLTEMYQDLVIKSVK